MYVNEKPWREAGRSAFLTSAFAKASARQGIDGMEEDF
jgi:hypothetical protein